MTTLHYLLLPASLLGIVAIEAMGLQLILGGAGLLTLGHTAFFAIGGYASAAFVCLLAPALHIIHPIELLLLGMVCAVAASGLAALLVSIPCLRLRGDYLAVATLGFGQIVENVLYNIPQLGGASGFTNIPKLVGVAGIWLVVAMVALFLTRFYTTGVGQSIVCSRDDELVARCFGMSPERAKLTAFVVGNIITGIAGALYVHSFQFISPSAASFQKSVEILLAVVIGGMFSIRGSLLGATMLVLVPECLRFLPHVFLPTLTSLVASGRLSEWMSRHILDMVSNSMLLFSLIVLMIVKKNAGGLMAMMRDVKNRVRA